MDIMQKAINSQITFLKNINASFKIQLPDGQVFFHDPNHFFHKPKQLKRQKRNPEARIGEVTAFVTPLIETLEPGQSVDVPRKFHIETLRCVIGAYAKKTWGAESYLTQNNPNSDSLTVMRLI